ncbi:MAG: hypothetical protein P1V97_28485 [Planctomycetota bacterium]|nr:hypothetical protein [Planctomycetota bacterium]
MTTETPKAKRMTPKRIAVMVACLAALSLVGLGLKRVFHGMITDQLATVVWGPIVENIRSSDLEDAEHQRIVELIDKVTKQFESKTLTESQLYDLSMKLSRRYIAKLARIMAAKHQQFDQSDLSVKEKQRIDRIFQRFARAVLEKKLKRRKVRAVYEQWRSYGHRFKPRKLGESEREQLLSELQSHADNCEIPEQVEALNLVSEFEKAIKDSLQP